MNEEKNLEIIKKLINDIDDKSFNLYVFVPELKGADGNDNIYSSEIEQLYQICYFLSKNNYNAKILTEKQTYKAPMYLSNELKSLTHVSSDKNFTISPSDFIILPEYLTNILQQIADVNCEKIIFMQSIENTIHSLPPGLKWINLNAKNIIVTNDNFTDYINTYDDPSKTFYDIKKITLGVPEFFNDKALKKPKIGFFVRNPNDIKKITKLFYLKYPMLSWMKFVPINGETGLCTRKEFAKNLNECAFTIWVDRIAGFGTLPLEAMKSGSVVVGVLPDIIPNYVVDGSGIWANNIFSLVDELGNAIQHWFLDSPSFENISNTTKEIISEFSMEKYEQTTIETFEYFINKRKNEFIITLNNLINKNNI